MDQSEEIAHIRARLSSIDAMLDEAKNVGGVDPDTLATLELEADTLVDRLLDLEGQTAPSQSGLMGGRDG